jgi:hypothetical protein
MAGRERVKNIRVEIKSRSKFWHNAVSVEWSYQFPDRQLQPESHGFYLIEEGWLEDLQRVAAQCFSEVLLAPHDPGRRQLFRKLLARGE